jgi:hypothetical protein
MATVISCLLLLPDRLHHLISVLEPCQGKSVHSEPEFQIIKLARFWSAYRKSFSFDFIHKSYVYLGIFMNPPSTITGHGKGLRYSFLLRHIGQVQASANPAFEKTYRLPII